MAEKEEIPVHPMQTGHNRIAHGFRGQAPVTVTMRAYEVYCHLYHEQKALVTGECRGGFGTGELVAFLYARSFPKEEWRRRTDEAFAGFKLHP